MYRYATGIDTKNWDLLASCFTPDATTDYGDIGRWSSAQQITEYMAATHAAMPNTNHMMHNIVVDVGNDGRTATATTYVHVVLGLPDPGQWVDAVGRYNDKVILIAGVEDRWTRTVREADGTAKAVPSANHGKGLRWRARYVDDDGNERAKGFSRKSDAQKFLDTEVTAKFATGTYIEPSAGRVTVSTVYQSWFPAQAHITAKTATSRRSVWNSRVEPRWGDTLVAEVRPAAVRGWIAAMVAEGAGTPIIENAFGLLRQVLGAAVEDNRLARNPCEGVKLPKRKHADRGYLSHAQVIALAAAVDRDPLVVRFLSYTGLRWSEMAALRVQDFDMLRRRVNVSRSVTESGGLQWGTPKSWERRSVPFPAALSDELAASMVAKGRDDLVFTDTRGGVLRNSNWRSRVFRPAVAACQAADPTFPIITPHDLRHTAASLAVSAHANVKAVQRMLGHAKASMTLDVYADLFDEDLDEVAGRLDDAIQATADALRTGSER